MEANKKGYTAKGSSKFLCVIYDSGIVKQFFE